MARIDSSIEVRRVSQEVLNELARDGSPVTNSQIANLARFPELVIDKTPWETSVICKCCRHSFSNHMAQEAGSLIGGVNNTWSTDDVYGRHRQVICNYCGACKAVVRNGLRLLSVPPFIKARTRRLITNRVAHKRWPLKPKIEEQWVIEVVAIAVFTGDILYLLQ